MKPKNHKNKLRYHQKTLLLKFKYEKIISKISKYEIF